MSWLITTYFTLRADKRAVTALEYSLIAAAIAAVTVTAFTGLGTHAKLMLNTANNAL